MRDKSFYPHKKVHKRTSKIFSIPVTEVSTTFVADLILLISFRRIKPMRGLKSAGGPRISNRPLMKLSEGFEKSILRETLNTPL